MIQNAPRRGWLWITGTVPLSDGVAAPIEGEVGSNAAALLVLLGLGALFMGLRNLREIRHKRLIPDRRHPDRGSSEESD